MRPKILIIAASLRAGSHNARLAALAAKELTLAEADVTRISLADYALPIWAGVIPLRLAPGAPIRDERCDPSIPTPAYALDYRR